MVDLTSLVARFGVTFKKSVRPGHAALAFVYVLDDKFVLRARSLTADVELAFRRECSLLERVRLHSRYRLPEPMKSDTGERFVVSNGLFWTLHKRLPGRIICPWQRLGALDFQRKKRLILALRMMHDATRGKFTTNETRRFLHDIRQRYDSLKTPFSSSVRRRIERALLTAGRSASKLHTTGLVFVHGDFHWGNLLVDAGGRVTGLIDLDWCRVSTPLEDLAYTTMMLARDYRNDCVDLDLVEEALSWYKLDKKDRSLFYEYLLLFALFDISVFENALALDDRDRYLDFQKKMLELLCENC